MHSWLSEPAWQGDGGDSAAQSAPLPGSKRRWAVETHLAPCPPVMSEPEEGGTAKNGGAHLAAVGGAAARQETQPCKPAQIPARLRKDRPCGSGTAPEQTRAACTPSSGAAAAAACWRGRVLRTFCAASAFPASLKGSFLLSAPACNVFCGLQPVEMSHSVGRAGRRGSSGCLPALLDAWRPKAGRTQERKGGRTGSCICVPCRRGAAGAAN